VLLTSSRRRCTERLPTGVHYLLDSRGRYTADRHDVALAPFDNVEPDDTGKENSTPQLPPLVCSRPFTVSMKVPFIVSVRGND